ncbi:hypothetical protein D3C73_1256390 [compost metagenome]
MISLQQACQHTVEVECIILVVAEHHIFRLAAFQIVESRDVLRSFLEMLGEGFNAGDLGSIGSSIISYPLPIRVEGVNVVLRCIVSR